MTGSIDLTEAFFDTGAVTLSYAVGPASGPPLVLLHAGSARRQEFGALLPALTPRWHVYAPDLRGHGRSGWVRGHYRLEDYATDLTVFLERRIGQPAVLVGRSLGGQVALMVAARRPSLVRAVINGDAPLAVDRLRDGIARNRPMLAAWRSLAGSGRPVEAIAAALRETPMPSPGQGAPGRGVDVLGDDHPWFVWMAENLRQLDPDQLTAVIDDFDATHRGYEAEALLPAIRCPVLLLQADPAYGGVLTDEEVAWALPLLAQGRHVRLAGLGHGLYLEQPEPVLRAMMTFLASL